MSAAERCLSRKRTVIFDSHNNIKGYRYQLWCHARSVSAHPGPRGAAKKRCCRAPQSLRCPA